MEETVAFLAKLYEENLILFLLLSAAALYVASKLTKIASIALAVLVLVLAVPGLYVALGGNGEIGADSEKISASLLSFSGTE